MTFVYRQPARPCPPVSALDTLPLAEEHPYALVDPFSDESERRLKQWCTYQRAEIGDGDDMLLADHVLITAEIALYRKWSDSRYDGLYPALPVESENLDDWSVAVFTSGDRGVWWQGCRPATPCRNGEEPTVRTHAWETLFATHVGNLEFYVHVTYIAEQLPPDVEQTNLEIFRDLALAVMDSRERAD